MPVHDCPRCTCVEAVCANCGKTYVLKRRKGQKYCSTACRWDYWNSVKMAAYNAAKIRKARKGKR